MAILNHRFVSTVADGPYATQVQPSNWNEPHQFTGGTHGALVARDMTTASSSEGVSWIATPSAQAGAVLVSPSSSSLPAWWKGFARCSSQTDVSGTAALANVTGLSVALSSSRTYQFEALLYTTSSSASGVKFAVGGTATATSIIYEGVVLDGTSISAHTRASSLAAAVGGVNTVTAAIAQINGTITVNAAGTLTVQFAQNSSTVGTSSVLQGSTFTAWQIG